jgi:hypothetical protein
MKRLWPEAHDQIDAPVTEGKGHKLDRQATTECSFGRAIGAPPADLSFPPFPGHLT